VGSPLALQAAASPQRSVYRTLARLRRPRDESRVGGQGSCEPRARRSRNPPSPTAYPQVLNRGFPNTGRYERAVKAENPACISKN
jgi:hypothetical protein